MFGWCKVQINYKSGKSITIITKSVTVTKNHEGIKEVEWGPLLSPKKILFLGVDNIESIIQL